MGNCRRFEHMLSITHGETEDVVLINSDKAGTETSLFYKVTQHNTYTHHNVQIFSIKSD